MTKHSMNVAWIRINVVFGWQLAGSSTARLVGNFSSLLWKGVGWVECSILSCFAVRCNFHERNPIIKRGPNCIHFKLARYDGLEVIRRQSCNYQACMKEQVRKALTLLTSVLDEVISDLDRSICHDRGLSCCSENSKAVLGSGPGPSTSF